MICSIDISYRISHLSATTSFFFSVEQYENVTTTFISHTFSERLDADVRIFWLKQVMLELGDFHLETFTLLQVLLHPVDEHPVARSPRFNIFHLHHRFRLTFPKPHLLYVLWREKRSAARCTYQKCIYFQIVSSTMYCTAIKNGPWSPGPIFGFLGSESGLPALLMIGGASLGGICLFLWRVPWNVEFV